MDKSPRKLICRVTEEPCVNPRCGGDFCFIKIDEEDRRLTASIAENERRKERERQGKARERERAIAAEWRRQFQLSGMGERIRFLQEQERIEAERRLRAEAQIDPKEWRRVEEFYQAHPEELQDIYGGSIPVREPLTLSGALEALLASPIGAEIWAIASLPGPFPEESVPARLVFAMLKNKAAKGSPRPPGVN
jgi:hypothetical protein